MNFPWIKTIAVLEMVGGVVGVLFMVYVAMSSEFAVPVIFVGSFSSAIFVLSMLAGSWLWQGQRRGRTASIVIQCIQLPKVISGPLIFMFSFGFDVFAHVTLLQNDSAT